MVREVYSSQTNEDKGRQTICTSKYFLVLVGLFLLVTPNFQLIHFSKMPLGDQSHGATNSGNSTELSQINSVSVDGRITASQNTTVSGLEHSTNTLHLSIFNDSTRTLQAARRRDMAIQMIQNLTMHHPNRNMSDLLDVEGITLSPSTVENILHVRYYREANGNSSRRSKTSVNNTRLHFVSHIPKTGLSAGIGLLTMMLFEDPRFKVIPGKDKFRPCNIGASKRYDELRGEYSKMVCTLWMSEQPHTGRFQHGYTVLRDPRHHVLSQYFHCKESKDHQLLAHLMPSTLDEWLEAWVNSSDKSWIGSGAKKDQRFGCYDPRNYQSYFTMFQDTSTNWKVRDDKDWKVQAKNDLVMRFEILGDTARLEQSICAVSIRYTGWVNPRCDCTDISDEQLAELEKQYATQGDEIVAHGVTHHGSSYNTTLYQETLIDALTYWDKKLYSIAQEIFDDQLAAIESDFGVRICSALRPDLDWDGSPKELI